MALIRSTKITVSTVECYDAWSDTYDSDGNVLQQLDDAMFEEIAQPLLHPSSSCTTKRICCELGCGTGRNTTKVLEAEWFVIAVDSSTRMMTKAQQRVEQLNEQHRTSISWICHDLNSDTELPIPHSSIDAVICTLVIEHIASLDQFFQTIHRILKKNLSSWVLITAMHPDMYRAGSQAGFVLNAITGDKLCGISYDHSIEDIIETAAKSSLKLKKYVEEKVKDEEHAQKLGRRANKWIGTNIHASFLFHIQELSRSKKLEYR